MKKSNLITGILYVLFGVACLIVALLIETKLEGILWQEVNLMWYGDVITENK